MSATGSAGNLLTNVGMTGNNDDFQTRSMGARDFAFRRPVPPCTDLPPLPQAIGTVQLRTSQGSIIEWPLIRTGETDGMIWHEVIDSHCLVKLYDVSREKYTLLKRKPDPARSRMTKWQTQLQKKHAKAGPLPPLPEGHIGHRVRALMARSRLTAMAISDILGINYNNIHLWKNGKGSPNEKTLEKLERLFKRYGV